MSNKINHELTVQALALCVAEGIPVIIWGAPGTGKTSTINRIAHVHNFHLETVIASIREPSDFFGLPYFENGFTRTAAPLWVGNVLEAKDKNNQDSIIFYDEISTAPPATQAALLRPILEGYVGDAKLPNASRTVAAANPPDIAADGWELSPPAANRFVHLSWEPSPSDISSGFINGWKEVDIPLKSTSQDRQQALKKSRQTIGEFLRKNPKYAIKMSDTFTSSKEFSPYDYAFPTPRSWDVASKLYASAMTSYILKDGNKKGVSFQVFLTLLKGCVGEDAAEEFLTYIKTLDLTDPSVVLDTPLSVNIPNRGDQLQALLSAVEEKINYSNIKEYENFGLFLTRLMKEGKGDAAATSLKKWLSKKPENYVWSDEIQTVLSKFSNRVNRG